MKTKLFFVILILIHFFCFIAEAQKFCIDCSTDSVKKLMINARTQEDTLYAIVAKIDNMADNMDWKDLVLTVNKLIQLNKKLKLIETKPYELFRDGLLLWNNNEKIGCVEKLKKSIEEFDHQKKILGRYSLFNIVRIYFNYAGLREERFAYYQEKLRFYQEYGPIENTAVCLHAIAGSYTFRADYNNAINSYLKSAEVYKLFSPPGYANEICVVGFYYYLWGNNKRALYFLQTGYELSLKLRIWDLAIFTKIALALVEKKMMNYNDAMKNIVESLSIFSLHADEIYKAYKAISLSEKGGLFLEMNKPKEALQSLKEAIRFRDSLEIPFASIAGNFEGEYYLYKYYHVFKDEGNAEKQLLNAYRQAIKSKSDGLIIKYKKELACFYADIERPEKAITFALSYIAINDSLHEKQNSYNIAQYENEQKDLKAYKELQKQKLLKNSFVSGFAVVLLFAGVFFSQRNKIKKGKKLSDDLLLNILPHEVAEELKQKGYAAAKQFNEVTVIFTDFKGFTQISERLTPDELVAEIDTCFKAFDNIIGKYNIEKIKTIGDSYMAAGGLPVPNKTNATDVVNAALDIQLFMSEYSQQKKNDGKEIFEIRIGIHTGPVVAGIVGVKKFAYDIWGDTVNIASRMESSGEAGKINISNRTYELVKDNFNCIYRGKIEAKNKGEIDMYFVDSFRFR